ncbi:MAG: hypothetical protein RI580_18455 [Halothece sp. Uz-M2-17]|nr:hypothetical protein [Halothece sp. Uz-M2-17]
MTSQAKQRKIERRKRAEKILADLRGENNGRSQAKKTERSELWDNAQDAENSGNA